MSSTFLSLGLRPFYLGAATFAALGATAWMITYLTDVSMPLQPHPLIWHAHEMVFGFAPAVIVGFLLTAVRNWTNRPTPTGGSLAGLVTLWLAGRGAMLFDSGWIGLVLEISFLPIAALVVAVPIWQARNRRNVFVVALLLLLGLANIAYQGAVRGHVSWMAPFQATRLALDLILVLMIVIGGRVIPAFSGNAIAGLLPRRWLPVEVVAVGAPIAVLVLDAIDPVSDLGWLLWLCAVVHLIRMVGWQPWRTWRNPLLLALPLAYAWIPVHFLLRAEAPQLATHALTVGAMASLMLAMMTRSALGHTGRPLVAGPSELCCFGAIHAAAILRLIGASVPAGADIWLGASAGFWVLAFGTFAVTYFPILTRPRVDEAP